MPDWWEQIEPKLSGGLYSSKPLKSKYSVVVEWSGYCKGIMEYVVEAESEVEAKENWSEGKEIERDTIRDDTVKEVVSIEKLPE